ncbi:MAG: hypothetical protein WDO18_13475 [Acidobacteriota bacterium]
MYGEEDLTLKNGRFVVDNADAPLKVVLNPRGARIKVRVSDAKGEPVVGQRVIFVPRRLSSAQALASQIWTSYSDVNGECSAFTLPNEPPRVVFAPGEYTVLAVETPYNLNVDSHDQLWRALQSDGKRAVLEPEKPRRFWYVPAFCGSHLQAFLPPIGSGTGDPFRRMI